MTPRADLRRAIRARTAVLVRALSPRERAEAAHAMADLLAPRVPAGALVATYAPMGDEIDVGALDALLLARGCRLAFPRVAGDAPLSFHLAARDALAPGYRGIPEPAADAPAIEPDVLLVPLLAVDAHGNRLGQGKGHFDRTLAALRARRRVLAIGAAWDKQRIPRLAPEPWDQPLDALATPTRYFAFTR